MYKIRIHGRGGQGGRLAAKIIGLAAFYEGRHAQAFSLYGAERRGAPVAAFVRLDDEPVLERGYIYDPDCVVILDDSLIGQKDADVYSGLKHGGIVVINTKKTRHELAVPEGVRLYTVDATKIALETIGKPIFNTGMIGALTRLTRNFKLSDAEKAIAYIIGKRHKSMIAANLDAMERCYDEVKGHA